MHANSRLWLLLGGVLIFVALLALHLWLGPARSPLWYEALTWSVGMGLTVFMVWLALLTARKA